MIIRFEIPDVLGKAYKEDCKKRNISMSKDLRLLIESGVTIPTNNNKEKKEKN